MFYLLDLSFVYLLLSLWSLQFFKLRLQENEGTILSLLVTECVVIADKISLPCPHWNQSLATQGLERSMLSEKLMMWLLSVFLWYLQTIISAWEVLEAKLNFHLPFVCAQLCSVCCFSNEILHCLRSNRSSFLRLGELELPFMALLIVLVAPYQAMNLR